MSNHMRREVENLKRNILSLSAIVEESLEKAAIAQRTRDAAMAQAIIDGDYDVDMREVDIEEECQKILALHQPVASDLRFIIACLKINAELERIGDATVNIAERTVYLASVPRIDVDLDFQTMAQKAAVMLSKSLDALVNEDAALAYEVILSDDEVDAMNRDMYHQVQDAVRANINDLEALIHCLGISRHLERIADHATNIAEDVIYMIEGQIVRHRTEDYEGQMEKSKK